MPTSPLVADRLRAALGTADGWHGVEVVASAGSTNADLAATARAGAAPRRALLTTDQTAGRGRLDRRWVAPTGSALACSVLLRPDRPLDRWSWLSLLTGLAVVDAIAATTGLDPGLKWPNDVLLVAPGPAGSELAPRKVCGILAERVEAPDGPVCVVGAGINVTLAAADLPVPTATSLALAGAPDVDVTALAAALLGALARRLDAWEAAGDEGALAAAYRERCTTLGRSVRVQLPTGDVSGTAETVDGGGRLVVATPDGRRAFSAGDVVHLR